MSEHTITIPLTEGETLAVDLDGAGILGYRVISEDEEAPQTAVASIEEAIRFACREMASLDAIAHLANI